MNLCVFQGRLTYDPELKATANGSQVVNFSIAIDRRYKEKTEATFLECEAWGTTGEFIARYFRKGDPILITDSEAKVDSWTDSNEIKRSKVRFRVNKVEFVLSNSRKQEECTTEEAEKPAPTSKPVAKPSKKPAVKTTKPTRPIIDDEEPAVEEDDDIPF